MEINLGITPCPNDTFAFYAILASKIDLQGFKFNIHLEDIEQLNQRTFQSDLDLSKVSFHAYAYVQKDYQVLNTGSALGTNCGPLFIAKSNIDLKNDSLKVAIPGQLTTANFLLNYAYPKRFNKVNMLFSEIEEAILKGEADAGVIIHENRFTYQSKGLQKILDLGEYWEKQTGYPIPLGGIVVKRDLTHRVKLSLDGLLKQSIEYAFEHVEETLDFCKNYAQEMDREIMMQHIELYVNDFTKNLGENGKKTIEYMLEYLRNSKITGNDAGSYFIST